MKNKFLIFLITAILGFWPLFAVADFTAGLDAARKGDYAAAYQEWLPLAEQGYSAAQYNLGRMYSLGEGVQENFNEAVKWYRSAANQGHPMAQHSLAQLYVRGDGVQQDKKESIKWFRSAAEQGLAPSQYMLGLVYDIGIGTDPDLKEAVKWFRMAANQGYAAGQWALGQMYRWGRGIPQDNYKAVKWYRMAAEQGYAEAQAQLGFMYVLGDGVAPSFVQVVKWLDLAATSGVVSVTTSSGVQSVITMRNLAVDALTMDQLIEAQTLIASFQPKKSFPDIWYTEQSDSVVREPQPSTNRDVPKSVAKHSQTTVNRDTVREVQSHLTALGYNPGPADGISGKRTVAAVKEYQRFVGIQPDGILSSALLKILKTAAQKPKPERSTNKEPHLVSYGSGFIVSKEYVVTNRHVINECPNLIVYLDGRPVAGSVVASSAVDDLAIIKLAESASSQAKFRNSGRARLGESIRVVGYPLRDILASSMSVVSGEISALAGIGNNVRLIQMSAPVQPGNSGGPILDDSGNVIGMVVSKLDALKVAEITGDLPQNINFAIKGVIVKSFLDINGIDYQTAPSDVEKRGEEIAAEAKKYTVSIECYNQL